MAKLNHLGSFTDRPELKGQIDPDTGKKWQFMPDLLYWRDYEKNQGATIAQTKEGRIIAESPETGGYAGETGKMGEATKGLMTLKSKARDLIASKKKPEEPTIPDRATFVKEFVLPRLNGVDPYAVNVGQRSEQLYRKNIDKYFKQVFPDIPIGGMLTEEQQKHWQKTDEKVRQHYYNWVKNENDFQKDLYGHMMGGYEKNKAEMESKEKARKELTEKALKETPEEKRRAEERYDIRAENRDYQRKIETEIRKELVASGKTKDLKRTDVSVLTNAYLGLMKEIEEGNEEKIKLRIKSINKIRATLNLGPMKTETTPGKGKSKILGIPIPYTGKKETKAYTMDFGLPPGLTEEDIEYNMNKYNKTREEVINKFRGKK